LFTFQLSLRANINASQTVYEAKRREARGNIFSLLSPISSFLPICGNPKPIAGVNAINTNFNKLCNIRGASIAPLQKRGERIEKRAERRKIAIYTFHSFLFPMHPLSSLL
jgi:hypothetical protein